MEIQLNKEQKIVLLKALRDNKIDYDELARVNLRPEDKYSHMSAEEYDEELKTSIFRTCLVESEYPDLVQQCCKARHDCGCGCYLSTYFWKINPDREMLERIKAVFRPQN